MILIQVPINKFHYKYLINLQWQHLTHTLDVQTRSIIYPYKKDTLSSGQLTKHPAESAVLHTPQTQPKSLLSYAT